jgi:hypothetical protein
MKTVFTSMLGHEAELIRAQLESAGFHAEVSGPLVIGGMFESSMGALETNVAVAASAARLLG